MFFYQVVSTIVAGTVQLGVQAWIFSNIDGLFSVDQKDGFICPYTTVFGTASIIVSSLSYCAKFGFCCSLSPVVLQRGVFGPQHLFSHGQLYYGLIFFFPAGILARCSSGLCTTSSKSVSPSTSTSRWSPVPQTLAGGSDTTVSRFMMIHDEAGCFFLMRDLPRSSGELL